MMPCDQHDFIEIACMYNYSIELTLKSGYKLEGVACDTQCNESRQECIKLKTHESESLVVLDTISRMDALVDNPHFSVINFH